MPRSIPPLSDQPAALICRDLELLAKRTKKSDQNAAAQIENLTKALL